MWPRVVGGGGIIPEIPLIDTWYIPLRIFHHPCSRFSINATTRFRMIRRFMHHSSLQCVIGPNNDTVVLLWYVVRNCGSIQKLASSQPHVWGSHAPSIACMRGGSSTDGSDSRWMGHTC